MPNSSSHAKRLSKWRNLVPPQTRLLLDGVLEQLVPKIEEAGFRYVNLSYMGNDYRPSGREILLERTAESYVDSITLNFDKYQRPRFQIHGARRAKAPPHPFIRSADLVHRESQYYCFWGKPWWIPTQFWPAKGSEYTINSAKRKIGVLISYLETGDRGRFISKQVHCLK